MVRLKELSGLSVAGCNSFQFLMVRLKGWGGEHNKPFNEFQFLMVRLKGNRRERKSNRREISIPYGSIKRKADK